jgi:2-polyprenyl-3-methyl-5-hydroxy-6-metoxy-1,4-benzoquinol methylase
MASNENLVVGLYGDGSFEDMRASRSRADGLEFHYTKKLIGAYIDAESTVIEIGCATGYYGMYFAGRCKSYLGIDIVPANIDIFNEKIKKSGLKNIQAQTGDATALAQKDGSFDVVLVLGPMYHLPPDERDSVMKESKRVCKRGGVIAFAYINKVGAYVKACLNEEWKHIYPNLRTNDFIFRQGTDDERPGLFFFTMPEEIERIAAGHGLTVLKNTGVDFTFNAEDINNMPEEQFAAWMEISDWMCSSPSCTGMSNHALLICRKEKE